MAGRRLAKALRPARRPSSPRSGRCSAGSVSHLYLQGRRYMVWTDTVCVHAAHRARAEGWSMGGPRRRNAAVRYAHSEQVAGVRLRASPANGGQQDGVAGLANVQSFRGQWRARGIDGCTTNERLGELEGLALSRTRCRQHFERCLRNLGSNSISRKHCHLVGRAHNSQGAHGQLAAPATWPQRACAA
jgi:hypothetical protein